MLGEFAVEIADHLDGELVDAVVVVAVLGEVALDLEIGGEALLVADGGHLGVLDGGEAVHEHGEPGDAAGHRAHDRVVVQRHLEALVAVLVVHVVDRVERVHVQLGEPRHDLVEVDHDLLEDEGAALAEDAQLRADLRVVEGDVHAAVDRVEQGLGEVDARAEELELLADAHRGDAAGDAVVVAELRVHERVVLVLD